MTKRAEAASGFSQKSPLSLQLPSSCCSSSLSFMLALGTRPEHEAADSTLPDNSPRLRLLGFRPETLRSGLVFGSWAPVSGVSSLVWLAVGALGPASKLSG